MSLSSITLSRGLLPTHFQLTSSFQLTRLQQIANLHVSGEGLFVWADRSSEGSFRRLHKNIPFADCVRRLIQRQPRNLLVESGNDSRRPLPPHYSPLTFRQAHLDGVQVAEQPLSKLAVEPLGNRLVAVNFGMSALNSRSLISYRLRDSAHEFREFLAREFSRRPRRLRLNFRGQGLDL